MDRAHEADWATALDVAHAASLDWLEGVADRPIAPANDYRTVLDALMTDLPTGPTDATAVVSGLAAAATDALLAVNSPRFHGWVMGGAMPAGVAAEWMVAAWDQNAGATITSPLAAAIEQVTATWMLELLGLPEGCSVGFVTGGTMANFTCLAAARGAVSRAHGWDVDARGIVGGPAITVVGTQHTHSTVPKVLRLLGIGHDRLVQVAFDDQARIDPAALAQRLARTTGPIIVTTQAGDIHTGGVDRFDAIADVVDEVRSHHPSGGVWLHVDGAVGLWGAASPVLAPQFVGLDRADSWSTDAHKWLSTPYDSGVAIVAHPSNHHRAMAVGADYLLVHEHADRDPMDWTPELSRRARATSLYATLRCLGRSGVVELVERSHRMAGRCARRLAAIEGIEVCNEVNLNQVMVRCWDRQGDAMAHTPAVLAAVQAAGITFPTHGEWDGLPVMRLSFSHWATDVDDVDRTVGAIAQAHHRLRN